MTAFPLRVVLISVEGDYLMRSRPLAPLSQPQSLFRLAHALFRSEREVATKLSGSRSTESAYDSGRRVRLVRPSRGHDICEAADGFGDNPAARPIQGSGQPIGGSQVLCRQRDGDASVRWYFARHIQYYSVCNKARAAAMRFLKGRSWWPAC